MEKLDRQEVLEVLVHQHQVDHQDHQDHQGKLMEFWLIRIIRRN